MTKQFKALPKTIQHYKRFYLKALFSCRITLPRPSTIMSENGLPRDQDEFFSSEAVEDFYNKKARAFDEMQSRGVIDTLKDIGKLNDGEKLGTLLDVGCGFGIVTSLIAKHFDQAIGVDLSANMIKKAKELGHSDHIQFKVGSCENLPVADGSVDVITSIFSIHHFDISRFTQECRRVLKPGGVAIFYTDFLSMLTSLEDDKLPPIVDEIKEYRATLLATAKAESRSDFYLFDDFKALYDLIDWPSKRRITRTVVNELTLNTARDHYLGVPTYSAMAAEKNPVIQAYQKMNRVWNSGILSNKDVNVRASWDASLIILY